MLPLAPLKTDPMGTAMSDPISPLDRRQTFCFACSPQVPCFNACCRDLCQALTPYDVLRLKQHLNLSSADFLKRYTESHTGPGTGLPVVGLRFREGDGRVCPFVTVSGCRVYAARPASCRTYPLARGVSRHRHSKKMTEYWALIREPHCLGFANGHEQTVDQWIHEQQLDAYHQANDRMLTLIARKNRFRPGPLTPVESARVFTALYDVDTLRGQLSTGSCPAVATIDRPRFTKPRQDDLALLVAAMEWVEKTIFAAPAPLE
jgi:Fe-S-cluster containining protein